MDKLVPQEYVLFKLQVTAALKLAGSLNPLSLICSISLAAIVFLSGNVSHLWLVATDNWKNLEPLSTLNLALNGRR